MKFDKSKLPSRHTTAEGAKKATSSSSPKGEAKPRKPKQPKTSKYASAQMDDEVVVAGSLSGKTTPAKKGSISKSLKKGGEGEGIGKDGRKVETLTFMNDDGYMVTEEVFVDEAAATALASVANADEGEASAVTGGLAVSVAGRMVEDDDDDDSLIPRKPIISTKPATNIIDDDDDDDSLIPRKPSTLTSAKSPPKAAVTTKQSGLTTYFKKG